MAEIAEVKWEEAQHFVLAASILGRTSLESGEEDSSGRMAGVPGEDGQALHSGLLHSQQVCQTPEQLCFDCLL